MGESIYSGVSREGKNHFLLYNYINGGSDFQQEEQKMFLHHITL